MKKIKVKIKIVFVPYLIISLATVIGWTFLYWLLFIKLNVYPVSEIIRTVIIPLVLSVTSLFIWLNKRLDLLSIKKVEISFFIFLCQPLQWLGLVFLPYNILY